MQGTLWDQRPGPEFQDMLRGFNNKVYEMDRRLWDFGQLAAEMGLKEVFVQNPAADIRRKLKESEKGREWIKKFKAYLDGDDIGGWRMRRMNDLTEPYWLEDPSDPFGIIKNHLAKDTADVLGGVRGDLAKKRENAIAAFLQKVPPEEKPMFEMLITLAGKASAYSEEHDLYCELIAHALMRRGYLAMGRRLAESGTIDQPEDIFMLNPDEIDRVMMVPDRHDLRFITRRRRAAWEEWQTRPNPPVITDRSSMEEAVMEDLLPSMDAIAIKVVVGEMPEYKPELKADMFGICGCSGEVEGIARVVMNYEDLKEIQSGDILVCPGTNPAWTPVYGMISAVIADRGGTLSHAAIIGREYGVPTIVNTFEGTSKLKTGQRLRINAKDGAIYILDK